MPPGWVSTGVADRPPPAAETDAESANAAKMLNLERFELMMEGSSERAEDLWLELAR